jgi:hypothetical protein
VPSASNPTAGETLPSWSWSPIQGAVAYDFSLDLPDGTHKDINNLRMAVLTPILLWGTGVWHWKVRAVFPTATSATIPGPYSAVQTFTRTIGEPQNVKTDADQTHVLLSWDPRLGAKDYIVQIADRPDFATTVENVTTENTTYAPPMTKLQWLAGKALYWRVAARDAGRNQGDWAPMQTIRLQPKMRVSMSITGKLKRGRKTYVRISVRNGAGKRLVGARVRMWGVGLRAVTRSTNTLGMAIFTPKPRKRGTLYFRVTKAGFQPAYTSVRVR